MSDDWDYWEARDAWESTYYIVEDPPIAYGYMFEGCLFYDGCDFCGGFFPKEHDALVFGNTTRKQVPRWIAEAYGDGDICPEEVDWHGDNAIEWPLPPRTCTQAKSCWGSVHCRAGKDRRSAGEIAELVHSLAAASPCEPETDKPQGEIT